MTTTPTATTANGNTVATKPPFVKCLDCVVAVHTAISSVYGPNSTFLYLVINIH